LRFHAALFFRFFLLCTWGVLVSDCHAQGKCINGLIDGQWPCDNVELISHVPNEDTGGLNANDIWGWTDPLDGREYVLMGKRDGTWFIEVTNPSMPRTVGHLSTTGLANSLWRDIKVVGHHMVVVSEAVSSRLQVFDLTRLRDYTSISMPITFSTDTVISGFSKAHNVAVSPQDSLVFVCGPNAVEGLLVYDFANPELPELVGSWSEAYVHDAQVVNYSGPDVEYQGHRIALVACESTFRILDVTDPADIQELSSAGHTPYGYIHQGWLTPDHRYFLLGDESDETSDAVSGTTTYVYDVQDLTAPGLVSAVDLGTEGTDHNLYTVGDFVSESNYRDGWRMFLFDSSAPQLLSPKAFFDTQPEMSGPGFEGSWSNYPYFDSGTIAVSDQSEGLFLVRTSFMKMWPEFPAVCPTDTLHLQVMLDSCVAGPVALHLPNEVTWCSHDSLPGPGVYTVDFAGFGWSGMAGMTIKASGGGVVHADQIYVDVTSDAQHFPDADGDGYGVFDGVVSGCNALPGYAHVGGDCNDQDAGIHPGLFDPCDGIDNDCDQGIDEDGESIPFYLDLDGDGVAGSAVFESCVLPPYASLEPGSDCNDLDASIFPGGPPTLSGLDNDCNGYILGLEQLDGGCPGDLNHDEVITIQDLLEFLNLFGDQGWFEADLNYDQHVGAADLLIILSLLGNNC
jgi:choice-of-anchor B domain-containing protein